MTAINVSGVTKQFDTTVAVRNLSLVVPRGSVYGLLGPNGAGKTTLIRMILDIIVPDSGTIEILGRPHLESGVSDLVGYLPEERGLYKKMRVRRVLRFLAELKGVAPRVADRRIDEWLERLGLSGDGKDWGKSKVDVLSRELKREQDGDIQPHMMDNAERLCNSVCIIASGDKVSMAGLPRSSRRRRDASTGLACSCTARNPRSGNSCAVSGWRDRSIRSRY